MDDLGRLRVADGGAQAPHQRDGKGPGMGRLRRQLRGINLEQGAGLGDRLGLTGRINPSAAWACASATSKRSA